MNERFFCVLRGKCVPLRIVKKKFFRQYWPLYRLIRQNFFISFAFLPPSAFSSERHRKMTLRVVDLTFLRYPCLLLVRSFFPLYHATVSCFFSRCLIERKHLSNLWVVAVCCEVLFLSSLCHFADAIITVVRASLR